MIKSILAILLLTISTTSFAYMLLPIDSVYDGDTIKTHVNKRKMPAPLNLISIRIRGIDTPEMPAKSYYETGKLSRAACIKEAELALKARQAVVDLITTTSATKMKVENFKWGKFGGRVIADVKISGIDIAQFLILKGYATPYDGGKKTHDWCL